MCRSTAAPLMAMIGIAGTAAGVGLAVIRERIDRRADARAMKAAAKEQENAGSVHDDDDSDSGRSDN
jgi:hypothetical protein